MAICLNMLDINPKHLRDQNRDCSRRNDPVYIGRVVSAMVSPRCSWQGVPSTPHSLGCKHPQLQLWQRASAIPSQLHHFPSLGCFLSYILSLLLLLYV